jgi:hypothetical protein
MGHRDIVVRDDNNNEIQVSINDPMGIITQSSLIAQVFARALIKVISSIVSGAVGQIIVEFGKTRRQIEVELHTQRVRAEFDKVGIVVEECSRAVLKAKASNAPQQYKDEWIDRLEGLMYKELAELAPSAKIYYR